MITLKEWQTLTPNKDNKLYNVFLNNDEERKTAELLKNKGFLNIIELRKGISISTNSYVGKIKLGSLHINIFPKIDNLPLFKLLKYTYGLKDLNILSKANYEIKKYSFLDLLIYQLCIEIEHLINIGLNKNYIKINHKLSSPKGRINFNEISKNGGFIGSTLPCTYYKRLEDNTLNQVLLSGIYLGISITDDKELKIKLKRIANFMEINISKITLNKTIINKAYSNINRLVAHYKPALELINIIYEGKGVSLEKDINSKVFSGFLFDMNKFFQSFVSKLLKDYILDYEVKDEFTLHNMFQYAGEYNPKRKKAPMPRPDFAIMKKNKVITLLDAKYRDLWENPLPREMLYQLAIYAVSNYGNNKAKILYPSMNSNAKLEKINIINPINGESYAEVIMQPINLNYICNIIDENHTKECSTY
ncbi:McrC family protein, partial [Clostridium tarantellae]